MNSYPDFGIYPEDLDYCAEVLEKVFKKYPVTDAEYDEIQENIRREVEHVFKIKLIKNQNVIDHLTNIINITRITESIKYICKKYNLKVEDFTVYSNGKDIVIAYQNKPIE